MNAFRLADGRTLAWREAGVGRPLVLLHGWAMSSAVFAEAIDALASDCRVLAPDLCGHGGTDPGAGYALADFAADLREWFDASGLEEFNLLGWSLGGEVAIELYPAVRDRLRRLVLVGATPRFVAGPDWPHGLPDIQGRAMARDLRRAYEKTLGDFFALQFEGENLPCDRFRRIAEFAVRLGRLPAPEVALAALETLRGADLRDRLGEVEVPTLVQHGELDRIIPAGAGRFLGERLPQARYVEIPGAGHAPFLSRPEETFALWREFLA
jgi:pimeloyl-[acyl-carrier protein] methyl ester esterase